MSEQPDSVPPVVDEWARGGPLEGEPVPDVPGARVTTILKSDRYARTLKVALADGRPAIHKTSVVVLPPGLRVGAAARRLARREADHLERLAGVPGIPALLGRPTPDTFLRGWIDGDVLRSLDRVPDRVFPDLRVLLAAVHERGVAYADLAKEENTIVESVGPDGDEADQDRPWLIDFQISISRDAWPDALVDYLQAADRYYLARHIKRRRRDQLNDEDRAALARGQSTIRRLHRLLVKKPYNLITRRVIRRWSGAGEGRRPGESIEE